MPPETETDEIEVTELVERIEALEKENSVKEKITDLENRIQSIEETLDALAAKIGGE